MVGDGPDSCEHDGGCPERKSGPDVVKCCRNTEQMAKDYAARQAARSDAT